MEVRQLEALEPRMADDIEIRTLWGAPGGVRALVLDWPPGSQWPGVDVHEPGPEVVYVVHGDLVDGDRTLRTGDVAIYPAGSSHSPRTETGCRLVVFYPEG